MFPRILTLIFIACSFAQGEDLSYGMSAEDVRVELGSPESKMSLGEKEVWIYTDGSRMEFVDGKLRKANNTALTPPKKEPKAAETVDDPLIKAEDIVQNRQDKTISASIQTEDIDLSSLGESYKDKDTLRKLQDALGEEERGPGQGPEYSKSPSLSGSSWL